MFSSLPWKVYGVVVVLSFVVCFLASESSIGGRPLNRWIRKRLGKTDLHDYLAEQSREMDLPYDINVEECDYRTMTAK